MKLLFHSNYGEGKPPRVLSFKHILAGCFALALAVLLAGFLLLDHLSPALASSKPVPGKLTLARYIQTGLWRADARTLVAVGRWLFQPDPPVSPVPTNFSTLPSVASTNSFTGQAPA